MNQLNTSKPVVSVLIAGIILAMAAASSLGAQTTASSSAFGESATVRVLPLLGSGVSASSGPLPEVSGSAGPAYSRSNSAASASLSTAITGEILRTGLLEVGASSQMPGAVLTRGTAVVDDTAVTLGQLIPLLSLRAGVIESAATIDGTCGSSLTATGSANLAGVTLGGVLGLGLSVPVRPSPNTVLLDVSGVRIVLNEQIRTGDGTRTQELTVNALHIYLDNALLSGLGVLSGDIVIAGSRASVQCPAGQGPNPTANLVLTGSDSPDPVAPGGRMTYTFTVANQGPDPATQVVLSNTPPAGLGAVSTSASQGSCSPSAPAICTLGTLAAGQSATVTVAGTVNATAGTLTDTATVTSGVSDPDSSGNTVTLTTQVSEGGPGDRQADLALSAASSPSSVQAGQPSRITFTVVNRGPDAASLVTLTGPVDPRTEVQSIDVSQGSCSTNGSLSCNLGSLGAGQRATLTLVVVSQGRETMRCEAAAASSVADPDTSNNSASADVAILVPPTSQPIDPAACRLDMAPAATLLFPYFEVDLDQPNGATTLIAVNNASPDPKLAQVTFWSDWGVPTFSFTLALAGHDVQTLNLRDVLGAGSLPPAARAPGCNAPAGALTRATLDHLQAWHCGLKSPSHGNCAAPARAGRLATGYITVDAVNRCTSSNPAEPNYFVAGGRGIASDDNVLWGDFFLVNGDQFQAHGDPAVHILALPNTFLGRYSFYGSFVGGSGIDDRQPLGTRYATRYVLGGVFDGGTQLVVWRDAKVARPAGIACGQEPQRLEMAGVVRDEEGKATALSSSRQMAPWSTQKVILGGDSFKLPYAFGWLNLDLWHKGGTLFGDTAQGWVTTVMSAKQRYSIGMRAMRLDSACDF